MFWAKMVKVGLSTLNFQGHRVLNDGYIFAQPRDEDKIHVQFNSNMLLEKCRSILLRHANHFPQFKVEYNHLPLGCPCVRTPRQDMTKGHAHLRNRHPAATGMTVKIL